MSNIYSISSYDKNGRLLPPKELYVYIAWAMRGYLIIILASAMGSDTSKMLSIIYTSIGFLYIHMAIGIPACITFGLVIYRHLLTPKFIPFAERLTWPLLFALILDLGLQLYMAHVGRWRIEPLDVIMMIIPIMLFYFIFTNQHIKDFNADLTERLRDEQAEANQETSETSKSGKS